MLGPNRAFLADYLPSEITTAIGQLTTYLGNDVGLGVLIPAGATINFTGHTLGGQVAYLLAEMVASTREKTETTQQEKNQNSTEMNRTE